MTTFKQWNCGKGRRGILLIIKKFIISYGKAARSSLYYAFAHHAEARLLYNDLLAKTIDLFFELDTVVEGL